MKHESKDKSPCKCKECGDEERMRNAINEAISLCNQKACGFELYGLRCDTLCKVRDLLSAAIAPYKDRMSKYGYIVLGARNKKDFKSNRYIMCLFEDGRVVNKPLCVPTIFKTFSEAQKSVRHEKECLARSQMQLRIDLQKLKSMGLYKRYVGLEDYMKGHAHGYLMGTYTPCFRIKRISMSRWEELWR